MWRLLVPLNYLRIKHPEKIKFDLLLPLSVAVLMAVPLLSEKFRTEVVSSFDILGRSSDLLSILTGFFIAALAAVSTFAGVGMDEVMPGKPAVTLKHKVYVESLTRRRFMSFLFGYLALLSLFVYLFGFAFYALQTYLVVPYFPDAKMGFFVGFWVVYCFLLGNLLANTLLGLFYLTDRIHRPNRALTSGVQLERAGEPESGRPEGTVAHSGRESGDRLTASPRPAV